MAKSIAPAPPDADFLDFQRAVAGQYSLERELGRGGMGIVYLAREVQLDRQVAIKVLPPALAVRAELQERFLREARTAAKLSHPNIVPIFRVDRVGDFVFIVMAFIDGETLTSRVRQQGPLPISQATRLIQEISWALAYAHARNVIHRDIKPDNIMLENGSGRAFVTDFGIAQVTEASQLTEAGQVMGTAHFMSPEQASGEPCDGRSDLYSLGIVAHFMLSGKLPFDGATVQSVLAKHLTQAPPPMAQVNSAVPRALAAAVDRCLLKDPAQRFASGEALADAVTVSTSSGGADLPMPLRMWLVQKDPVTPAYVAWSGVFGFSSIVGLIASIFPGTHSNGLGIAAILAVLPVIPLSLFRLIQTRKVLGAGYTLDDLRLALRRNVEREREEAEFIAQRGVSVGGKVLRWTAYGSLLGSAAFAITAFRTPLFATPMVSITVMLSLFGVTLAAAFMGMTYPGRVVKQLPIGDWKLRFWNGKLGAMAVRVASLGLGARRAPTDALQRPTEMAIGLAAVDLYAALPKEMQRQLGDLPELIKRLENDAQGMRKRVEELGEQLAITGRDGDTMSASVVGSEREQLGARRAQFAEELRAAKEAAGGRLGSAVAALENIRLDLLRLQAGTGTIASVTAAVDAARRVGMDIDVAIAARSDLAAIVPSMSTPT